MSLPMPSDDILAHLREGVVIPAQPLALDKNRKLDERRQRALTRYYMASGAGGLAVAVHTTQFEIREPQYGLLRPVLELAMEEMRRAQDHEDREVIKVAGVCGDTKQAVAEAQQAVDLGYDAALLSLAAMSKANDEQLVAHAREVSKIIPIIGFYLQPSVGGRALSLNFWRKFCEIENVVAIKMAPFNRYQTIDVVRAVAETGRALVPKVAQVVDAAVAATGGETIEEAPTNDNPIALYTGNDDHIVMDLLGNWTFECNGQPVRQQIVGGLLGHWACWTSKATELLDICHEANDSGKIPNKLITLNRQVTDMNAAIFDPANGFAGCIAGVHEVLRRQGLLEGTWCLNPEETLSPGQAEEIDRVCRMYPHLIDDDFVAQHLDHWLK